MSNITKRIELFQNNNNTCEKLNIRVTVLVFFLKNAVSERTYFIVQSNQISRRNQMMFFTLHRYLRFQSFGY